MPITTPSRVGGMVAVSKDSNVKPLGFIVWFSVPDENVPIRELKRAWGLAGLDPKPLPRDQRAVNIFKRAVRDEERAGTFTDPQTGLRVETDVRDVMENEQDVVYQVSRVVRDKDNQLVEYPKALRVHFSKVTEQIGFKALGDLKRAEVFPIIEAIQDRYDASAKTVTGSKVRTLVRHYIKDDSDEADNMVGLSGENLGGARKGVYFVLAKFKDQLEALAEMLGEHLYPDGRGFLYAIPLADGASERELIRRHHVTNCIAETEEAMADTANLLRSGRERAPRENVVKHHWRRLERLRRRSAQYADALNEEQEDLGVHMELLNKQLRKLMNL